jgi:hypothetical protein
MKPKFRIGQILLNRNTREKGTVRRVYDLKGITMYEVTIPAQLGSNISDWAEDVLEREQGHSPIAKRRKSATT